MVRHVDTQQDLFTVKREYEASQNATYRDQMQDSETAVTSRRDCEPPASFEKLPWPDTNRSGDKRLAIPTLFPSHTRKQGTVRYTDTQQDLYHQSIMLKARNRNTHTEIKSRIASP